MLIGDMVPYHANMSRSNIETRETTLQSFSRPDRASRRDWFQMETRQGMRHQDNAFVIKDEFLDTAKFEHCKGSQTYSADPSLGQCNILGEWCHMETPTWET